MCPYKFKYVSVTLNMYLHYFKNVSAKLELWGGFKTRRRSFQTNVFQNNVHYKLNTRSKHLHIEGE